MVFLHIPIVEVNLSFNAISILSSVDLKLPALEPKSRSDFHPLFSPSPQALDIDTPILESLQQGGALIRMKKDEKTTDLTD